MTVDEAGYIEQPKRPKMGVRSALMASLDIARSSLSLFSANWTPVVRAKNLGTILRYAMNGGFSRKKRIPVDVNGLCDIWLTAIVGMCHAHDKDTFDAHDAQAEKLLGPLLEAPVKQLREFYHALHAKMKADPRVPMLVWMGFEAWGEVMVKDAPDEKIKRLKNKLAQEITDLVEEDVKDQFPKAMMRALRWRDPEVLEEVKTAVLAGAKPKIRGRESCLFLEMQHKKKKVSVML